MRRELPDCTCDPDALQVHELEDWIGEDAEDWVTRCHEIAKKAAEMVDGEAVYGHYTGPVADGGTWDPSRPFQRHGWVKLHDGRVLDPTRWSFENVEPYIYIGSGADYDEGGNEFRRIVADVRPPPPYSESDRSITLSLDEDTTNMVRSLVGPDQTRRSAQGVTLGAPQVMWLANLPIDVLKPFHAALYRAIDESGLGAFIPVDNLLAVGLQPNGSELTIYYKGGTRAEKKIRAVLDRLGIEPLAHYTRKQEMAGETDPHYRKYARAKFYVDVDEGAEMALQDALDDAKVDWSFDF